MTAGAPLLVKLASSVTTPPHQEGRKRLFDLRSAAARLLPFERVAECGRSPFQGHVDLRLGDRASYSGIMTCGSVWMCPVCASKIAEGRRREIRALADEHGRRGGVIYLAAFTLRHRRWQEPDELREAVTNSWRRMLAGAPWKRAAERAGCRGGVRALEVTHGKNGWHPHLHVAFFLDREEGAEEFGIWLFERWSRIVHYAGFGWCEPSIWRFERAAHYDAAIDYVVKGNFDMELTRGHMKLGKGGGRSPWQLLDDARRGDLEAEHLFRAFAESFKGARQLTWFGAMREAHNDIELASEVEPGVLIGQIPKRCFWRVMAAGQGARVLDIAEEAGWTGVLDFLRREKLWEEMRP